VIRSPTGVRHPLQGLDPRLQVPFQYSSACIERCIVINCLPPAILYIRCMCSCHAKTAFHVFSQQMYLLNFLRHAA
jgi:hypothetical protein